MLKKKKATDVFDKRAIQVLKSISLTVDVWEPYPMQLDKDEKWRIYIYRLSDAIAARNGLALN